MGHLPWTLADFPQDYVLLLHISPRPAPPSSDTNKPRRDFYLYGAHPTPAPPPPLAHPHPNTPWPKRKRKRKRKCRRDRRPKLRLAPRIRQARRVADARRAPDPRLAPLSALRVQILRSRFCPRAY